MIRSATASSTRCREVFPSAGLPPPPLWLEPELALVLVLELALVLVFGFGLGAGLTGRGGCGCHGAFFSFGKCIELVRGVPGGIWWGTVMAQDARQGSQSRNAASLRGFRTISTD